MTDRLSKLESNSKSIKSLLTKMTKSAAKVSGSTTSNKRKATNDDDDASLATEVWPAAKPATLSLLISHLHDISIKDAVLDSGSTDNVFPEQLVGNLTSFRKCSINKVHIGDDSTLNTIGSGNFGILRGVIVCVGLIYPLVSVNYLTKILGYHIFFSHNRAYILDISSKTNDSGHTDFRIVTTATVSNITGLYQLDNHSDLPTPTIHRESP